jgi:myo-inositol-1(or 4)-monophosphatase
MDRWDLEKILILMKECGETALSFYNDPPMEFKEDRSVVTAADKAIEDKLSKHFDHPSENCYMIGEETVNEKNENYIQSALKGKTWIVDPIDGTAPYSNHIPSWGISIAFMENGLIREGAVYMPVFNEILVSNGDKVFFSDEFPASMNLRALEHPAKEFNDGSMISVSQKISKLGKVRMYNPVQTMASCVYSLACMALGRYAAYIATVKLWDIAAGLVIAKRLEFEGRLLSGIELDLEVSEKCYVLDKDKKDRWSLRGHGIIAANREIIDLLHDKIDVP